MQNRGQNYRVPNLREVSDKWNPGLVSQPLDCVVQVPKIRVINTPHHGW